MVVYPYLLEAEKFVPLQQLLNAGREVGTLSGDSLLQLNTAYGLGNTNILLGNLQEADKDLQSALRLAESDDNKAALFQVYISLLKTQIYYQANKFRPEYIQKALSLSTRFALPQLKAELYQALTAVHSLRGEVEDAQRYGERAMLIWSELDDKEGIAQTADMLHIGYRTINDQSNSEKYLELACELYAKTDNPDQYGRITYERGIYYLQHEEYEAALQWLDKAKEEWDRLPDSKRQAWRRACVYHSKGIALLGLKRYEVAIDHFRQSQITWNELGNLFDEAGAYNDWGYTEGLLDNKSAANRLLLRAEALSKQLPPSPRKDSLDYYIQTNLADLRSGKLVR